MDHVKVHYNSSQPAQLNALAYAQGSDIHIGPGQEKHLTGRALTFRMDSNPLAGAFWFERMKADHMQDILEEARNVANGK